MSLCHVCAYSVGGYCIKLNKPVIKITKCRYFRSKYPVFRTPKPPMVLRVR